MAAVLCGKVVRIMQGDCKPSSSVSLDLRLASVALTQEFPTAHFQITHLQSQLGFKDESWLAQLTCEFFQRVSFVFLSDSPFGLTD